MCWRVRIPLRWAQKRKAPIAGSLSNQWWAMRDVRVRLAPPASASGLRPSRAALENASRFLSSAPWRVRIPCAGPKQKTVPLRGPFPIQWWAMRDVACGFAARSRFGPAALACCAGKRFAFPQLRTLAGSNPMRWAQTKNGPLARTVSNSVVGDEGCRVRLRRPLSLRACGPRVLRWKTLRVSSAPHPGGFESHALGPNKKRSPCEDRFQFSGGR